MKYRDLKTERDEAIARAIEAERIEMPMSTFEFSRRHLGGAWLALPGAKLPTLLIRGRVVVAAVVGATDMNSNPWAPWVWSASGRRFGVEDRYSTARTAAEKATEMR